MSWEGDLQSALVLNAGAMERLLEAGDVGFEGAVIAGFDNGRLIAVDLSSGDVEWETMLSPPSGRSRGPASR